MKLVWGLVGLSSKETRQKKNSSHYQTIFLFNVLTVIWDTTYTGTGGMFSDASNIMCKALDLIPSTNK